MELLAAIDDEIALAISAELGDSDAHDPLVRRSDFADLQANFALALARRLGTQPRDLAAKVAARLETSALVGSVEVSGPGFVNLTLSDAALVGELVSMSPDHGGAPFVVSATKDTVVIDYSAPNVAKEMHVGHLRSTIIGDVLARVLGHLGHDVIRQNHIGDWGTPFGMLIAELIDQRIDVDHLDDMGDLTGLYQQARRHFDSDDAFADTSRGWVVKLQGGNEEARTLWTALVAESARYFNTVYDLLDVLLTDDDLAGESMYQDQLADVVAELDAKGMLVEADGALCLFLDGFTNREGDPLPLIVRKSDGGFGYAATDLAALRHRSQDLDADRVLIVVGAPQTLHLSMIFAAGAKAGWLAHCRPEHVAFGSVLGSDGKVLKTRAGTPVLLVDLLESAVERADGEVSSRHEDWSDDERAPIARAVGIGAVKFADLVNDRRNDYRFELDRMVATVGATGPYLQYARARIASILERAAEAGLDPTVAPPTDVAFDNDTERALTLELAHARRVLLEVAETLEPHHLCRALLDVAGAFSSFYEQSPVVKAEPGVRELRLTLCRVTEAALSTGLALLGIASPPQI
jgi:arginyl-tRNA synthetase